MERELLLVGSVDAEIFYKHIDTYGRIQVEIIHTIDPALHRKKMFERENLIYK